MTLPTDLPVVVIGGGPVGLAAAAHLLSRNLPVGLYEAVMPSLPMSAMPPRPSVVAITKRGGGKIASQKNKIAS